MRPLIITAFVSADGVMEAPGGGDHRSAGWTFKSVEFDDAAYEGTDQRGMIEHEAYSNGIQKQVYEVVR